MSMTTAQRAGPLARTCLLFSGGMDSLCFARLLQPSVLLYVTSNAPYTAQETQCVEQLRASGAFGAGEFVKLDGVLDLGRWERDDLIVPNRNAHLVLLASNYADEILLGSVEGDRSLDKDPTFYARMTALLDHMWGEQHWTAQRRFAVSSPFKSITKTALVGRFLADGGDANDLLTSYSCYRGSPTHCGVCKPCARKRVALENNEVMAPAGYWEREFVEAPWWEALWPAINSGAYRGAEDRDFVAWTTRKRGSYDRTTPYR